MRKLPRVINSDEYKKLLEFLDKQKFQRIPKRKLQQYKVAIILGTEAGLRISEIVGLKNKDDSWRIKPLAKENINQRRIEIRSGKGKKDRVVGLPAKMNEKYINMLPLKIKRRALQKFTTDLGLKVLNKHITFHTLRHSFATEFQRVTGDINTLATLMGHSSINTTAIYAHVSPDDAIRKQKEVFG
jgi:integrase